LAGLNKHPENRMLLLRRIGQRSGVSGDLVFQNVYSTGKLIRGQKKSPRIGAGSCVSMPGSLKYENRLLR
jgi:hypothetical protein